MVPIEGQGSERGRFFKAKAPKTPSLLIFNDVFGLERRVAVPFTIEELIFIGAARDAVITPTFRQAAINDSAVRPLVTSHRIP
jgi:hypothetical protein